jgi:putative hydrolase of the HAD superfamily
LNFDVVCFDYWNTLVHEARPGALVDARLPAMQGELSQLGMKVGLDDLRQAHSVAQAEFETASGSGIIYETIHASISIARTLGLPDDAIDALVTGFAVGGASSDVRVVEGAADLLMSLHETGIRLAIVCDVGLTPSSVLLNWLHRWELRQLFEVAAFSDRFGAYKPDPLMFNHVLRALGCVLPNRAVHVGDRRRTDVQGARSCGITTVRFAGVFDDGSSLPDADYVVSTMRQLKRILLSS